MATLQPAAAEMRAFLTACFRYADPGTYVSLRAFDQKDRGRPPVAIEAAAINGSFEPIIARAVAVAGKAANGSAPAVFAPPVATFNNPRKARAQDLANGLTLAVELDSGDPPAARAKLEAILGPATFVMASGGETADPTTGELHAKLHLHWRLSEPTRSAEEHATLREARWLAAVLVGGDRTAASPAHPLRWPGSWNLKRTPRLAQAIGGDTEAEIHLSDAIERLQEAVEATGLSQQGISGARTPGEPQAPVADVAAALSFIPNADLAWDDWNRVGMATWRATGGAEAGLEAWEQWSGKSGKHDAGACAARWDHFAGSPPSKIGAGTIFFLARAAGWRGRGGQRQEPPPPFAERAEAEAPLSTPDTARPASTARRDEPKRAPEPPKKPEPPLWTAADDWREDAIPRRPWIAPGYMLRGAVTIAAGMGSAGKSSLMVAWASSLALNQPHGTFQPVGPMRVMVYNVEDDEDEQRRRFSATLRQFEAMPRDLAGRVLRCGPTKIGTLIEQDRATGIFRMTDAWAALEKLAEDFKPDVVMLDPLAELHTAEENDNTALRHVVALLRAFAQRHNCAVVLIHHTRKGSTAGDMDAIRGASAVVGAARIALTVAPMTEDEAAQLNIAPDLRRRFFRVDNAKANYSQASEAAWHELQGYELDNGEEVAAAIPWAPRNQQRRNSGVPPEALALVAAAAERGTDQGPFSPRLAPEQPRSIAAVMVKHGITTPAHQKAALTALLQNGFTVREWYREKGRKATGLRGPSGAPHAHWVTSDSEGEA
jgi:hypothetical protein